MIQNYFKKDFFDVPKTTLKIATGNCDFPILYYDSSVVLSFFRADYDIIADKLQNTGLKPVSLPGIGSILGLAFFEYRDTSIGVYNEIGIALPAIPEKNDQTLLNVLDLVLSPHKADMGFYILDLPVTTEIAFAAGIAAWGYPKFVSDISFQLSRFQFESGVNEKGSSTNIFSIGGKIFPGLPIPFMDLVLFSQLNNKIIKTVVDVKAIVQIQSFNSLKVRVGNSSHIMAQNMKDLGLDGKRPFLNIVSNHYQFRLNLGQEINV